mgnify:CR=1 FL=1
MLTEAQRQAWDRDGYFFLRGAVDPAFAVGGERHKNPYSEKLDLAAAEGLEIDDGLFDRFPVEAVYAMHNWPAHSISPARPPLAAMPRSFSASRPA